MKHEIIILTVGLLSFGFGWWTNDMWEFADGVISDRQHLDNLRKNDSLFADSLNSVTMKFTKKKTFHDYISDDQFIHWTPNHPGSSGYLCEITLHEITALYWYHGQCAYDYFTYLTSDSTIDVLWSYRTDCISDMDFLEKSNGVKKYPKRADNFATFTLVNDTTIKVKYNFPEWAKKVNQIAKDSLFPTYYYLR